MSLKHPTTHGKRYNKRIIDNGDGNGDISENKQAWPTVITKTLGKDTKRVLQKSSKKALITRRAILCCSKTIFPICSTCG